MRVAVTGAGGFVGSAVVRRLLAGGASVVAFLRPGGSLERLADCLGRVEVVRADWDTPAFAAHAVARARPDVCVHAAAAGAVVRDPDARRVTRVNALAPLALVPALAGAGCRRLVTLGSSSEYGPVDGPMREDAAALPDDVYGAAKLSGALLARAAAAGTPLETVHLRLFSVYGPREDPRRLVASVAAALAASRPVDLTGGGQARDFVYVADVADAVARACTLPGLDGELLNVGTGRQTTVRELCAALAEAAGADPALLRFGALPYRAGERFSWLACPERAARLLGWRAATPLEQGLRLTVEHLRAGRLAA